MKRTTTFGLAAIATTVASAAAVTGAFGGLGEPDPPAQPPIAAATAYSHLAALSAGERLPHAPEGAVVKRVNAPDINRKLYTTLLDGQFCLVVRSTSDLPGGVACSTADGPPPTLTQSISKGGATTNVVYGLVPDGVEQVTIADGDGVSHDVTPQNNAFSVRLSDIPLDRPALARETLHWRDGHTSRIAGP